MKLRPLLWSALFFGTAVDALGIKDYEIRAAAQCLSDSSSLSMEVTCLHSTLQANCTPENWPSKCEMYADLDQKGRFALENVRYGKITEADAKRELAEAVERRAAQAEPTNYAAANAGKLSSPQTKQTVSAPTTAQAPSYTQAAAPSAAVSSANRNNIVSMIAGGDVSRGEVERAIATWRESPHEPRAVVEVVSALSSSPLKVGFDALLYVQCAIANQTLCTTCVSGLASLGLSMSSQDSSRSADYVVLIVPGDIRRSKAEESETQVPSTFISDRRQVPNPQYFALQNQYQSAQLQAQSAQQRYEYASQMPPGFAAGYAQGMALRQMREAVELQQSIAAALRSTSPTLVEDVKTPYTFTLVTTRALYQQPIGFMLIHKRSGSAWAAKGLVEAQDVFKVAHGVHKTDDQKESYSTDEGAADLWLAESRNFSKDSFLGLSWSPMSTNSFKGVQPQNYGKVAVRYFVDATPDQHNARPDAQKSAKVDRRFRSVVVVKSNGGLGAGFFISEHNLITNAHVVGADRSVTVRLYGRDDEVSAEVIAADPRRDLALLRTSVTGLPATLLQTGGDVPVGSRLVIVGHPRGLEFSLTSGVVSALRHEKDEQGGVQVIQTDTALNPGNSGGPVFMGDKVVGVASFKWRSSEGLGFAVHTSEIRKFLASAFLQ